MQVSKVTKSFFLVLFLIFIPMILGSCTSVDVEDDGPSANPGLQPLPLASRPRVAVLPFQYSDAVRGYGYGGIHTLCKNLPTRLEAELMKLGRFIILDRQNVKEMLNEQDFGSSDRSDPKSAAPIGKMQGAQILIKVKIMELKMNQSGGGIGVVTHGVGLGVGYKTSYVEVNVRAVHVATGQVLFTTNVKGTKTDVGFAAAGVFTHNGDAYWGAGGGFFKTPIGQAVQACLQKAAYKLGKAVGVQIVTQ